MQLRRIWLVLLLIPLTMGAWGAKQALDARRKLGIQPDGGSLVPTNQTVTPVGLVKQLEGERPKDMALSDDGKTAAVLTTGGVHFYDREGNAQGAVTFAASAMGIAWGRGDLVFASKENGTVAVIQKQNGEWTATQSLKMDTEVRPELQKAQGKNPQPTGLAVSPDGTRLYVALGIRNAVMVYDLVDSKPLKTFSVGVAPYRILLNPDGTTLYVANRGGNLPRSGDKGTAPSAGTAVKVSERDGVEEGTISLVETESGKSQQVKVGRNPSGLALSKDGKSLYVTNADSDTLSTLNTERKRITETLALSPPDDPKFGQMPSDCALSEDGKTLYITCGGANAVAVVALEDKPKVAGWFATGWYPIALRNSSDNTLIIASAKGLGAEPESKAPRFNVHNIIGTVQFVKTGDITDLKTLTAQVAKNNHWGQELPARANVAAVPIPERIGEPSVFKRVVYIIKENLTYDSVLGDVKEGNGSAKLCLFDEQTAPNHHALAREFVLLDNTYTSGTNSADGHQWSASSLANDYMEHNYSADIRSYPYDGGDPLAYSPEGFLWQAVQKAGKTVKVYGEFVNKPTVRDKATKKMPTFLQLWEERKNKTNNYEILADTDNAHLKPLLHPNYVGWPTEVSDQYRADLFLADLAAWEKTDKMPDLSILLLPCDHTNGTDPKFPTPKASVADNDLALGRIVAGISKSKFWKDTLILVIEDDSQLGVDHVSGHRTFALAIAPYTKRKAVVSELYNHTSLFRTMELVLGFPSLNRFDRTATPMTACFQSMPDLSPYALKANTIALDQMNPPKTALQGEAKAWASRSEKLDFSSMDRANAGILARAVWYSVYPSKPFPAQHFHAVVDEDDKAEK